MNNREDIKISLLATMEHFQKRPRLTSSNLCEWLANGLDSFYHYKTGKELPKLQEIEHKGSEVKLVNGRPHAIVKVCWPYRYDQSKTPEVEGIEQFLNGVVVKQLKRKNDLNKLNVKVSIDLVEWPHIARNLLSTKLTLGFTANEQSEELRTQALIDAELLLEHLYKEVNLPTLRLAFDLDLMPGDALEFDQWFNDLREKTKLTPAQPPSDFDYATIEAPIPSGG